MNSPIVFNNGKNPKWKYYLKHYSLRLLPNFIYRNQAKKRLENAPSRKDFHQLMERVNYYNKLEKQTPLENPVSITDFKLKDIDQKVYFFDAYQTLRGFPENYQFCHEFGDVVHIPETPSILKSRPISNNNQNSVVLKLNRVRHFVYIKKDKAFQQKKNKLVFRGKVTFKEQRRKFFEMYFNHPMCDLGDTQQKQINPDEWKVKKTSIHYLLQYKFILAIEGIDVASNLKWVMSSNSLAVMPKPSFETWFMEAKLIPNYHYVEIKPDFSDLEERLNYYIEHEDEALQIIKNANEYVKQFQDSEREELISLLVMQKYFKMTKPV
ncbi:glycosyl transferase family 90 [Psychroflexus planctonicus]|uniref:LPS biosynthesis protein n=1 Tax=Psychroflexus planctonicus TaxID=1526575 RepID=A0ABQ1SET3_9FLAO|nr:glycosyl transferase family 90 [Psychroflexus planctonicus]GGE24762.1 LPS biosynthesis protein [Psychroflexus planctonicus]